MGRGRQMLTRVQERQQTHRERNLLFRAIFAIAGACVVLGGVLLLVLPGPGLLVIAIGLAMLALEFRWAERALEQALTRLDDGVDWIRSKRRGGSEG
jgi:uncharacterized protein (TIGR02611 family)